MDDELLPAYIALIRRELKLEPGTDALAALHTRLSPTDPSEKLPARTPGIARLRRAARALESERIPDSALDEFAGDLRFLQFFAADDKPMPRAAMHKLLQDVMSGAPPRRAARKRGTATEIDSTVLPFSKKGRAE